MRHKLLHGLGAVALIIVSAAAFGLATGHCPMACLMKHIHGDKAVSVHHEAPTN